MSRKASARLIVVVTMAVLLLAGGVPAFAEEAISMYRLYNPYSGEHLYTDDTSEYSSLAAIGWQPEGEAWKAPVDGLPVFRLYNPYSGDHLYTREEDEYDYLSTIGWRQEGISFFSNDRDDIDDAGYPIYRLFNPYVTTGSHLYTSDLSEYYSLIGLGWQGDGLAFRAQSVPAQTDSQQRSERRMGLACDFVTDYLSNTDDCDDGTGRVHVLKEDEWLNRAWAYVDPLDRWMISASNYTSEPQRVWNVHIAWMQGDTYAVSYEYADEDGIQMAQLWPEFNEDDLIVAWS